MIEFSGEQVEDYMRQLDTNYRRKLIAYVLSLMNEKDKDADEAEDIVQEVFCRALYIVMARKTPFSNEQGYLYVSVKRLYFRKAKAKAQYSSIDDDDTGDIIDPREQPEQLVESREQLEIATEKIQAISSASVRTAMNRLCEGYSIQEISDELHIDKNTANNYITQGRILLRRSSIENEQNGTTSTKEKR